MEEQRQKKIAVIENESGEIKLDGQLIAQKIELAEILRDLVTQVEERAKPQEVSAAVDSKSTALVASPKKRALAEGTSEKPVEEEYLVAKLTSVAGAEQITPMPTATNVELMAFGKKPAKEPKEKKEPREKKAPKINLNDHCDPHGVDDAAQGRGRFPSSMMGCSEELW